MILSAAECELGLQRKMSSRVTRPVWIAAATACPTPGFVVMAAADWPRVDAAKSLLERELSQTLRFVFLPRGPVEESGDANPVN